MMAMVEPSAWGWSMEPTAWGAAWSANQPDRGCRVDRLWGDRPVLAHGIPNGDVMTGQSTARHDRGPVAAVSRSLLCRTPIVY